MIIAFGIALALVYQTPTTQIRWGVILAIVGLIIVIYGSSGSPSVKTPKNRSQPITLASNLFLLFGLGMSILLPMLLTYVAYYRAAPILPLIGDVLDDNTPIGMFGGLNAVLALGAVFVAVSIFGVLAGFWLRRSLKRGGKLGVVLVPLNFFFAVGFGIPILYLLSPLWLVLLVSGWRSLR